MNWIRIIITSGTASKLLITLSWCSESNVSSWPVGTIFVWWSGVVTSDPLRLERLAGSKLFTGFNYNCHRISNDAERITRKSEWKMMRMFDGNQMKIEREREKKGIQRLSLFDKFYGSNRILLLKNGKQKTEKKSGAHYNIYHNILSIISSTKWMG